MHRLSAWSWVALAGTILLVVSLGTNFYIYEGEARDAWLGIAHASEFLLATALVTIVLTALLAAGRSLVRGRTVGLIAGIMGLLGAAHLGYRMVAPPFDFELADRVTILNLTDSCLGYCAPSQAADVQLLPGIFIAMAGALLVAVGGFGHALSTRAKGVPANFFVAHRQTGLSPWLGIAGLGAIGQWLFGFTVFTFYLVGMDGGGQRAWSGWFPMPHTSVMVLWSTVLVVGLVQAAARSRAPLSPAALGGVISLLGLFAGTRILYRMIESPFGGGTVPTDLGLGAFLSVGSAVVVVVGGAMYALTNRPEPMATAATGARAEPT